MHSLLSSHTGGYFPKWWSPPKQRQRWGDSQVLLSTGDSWTNIFFDLFYVAGCINLGTILKEAAAFQDDYRRSILYFFGTGLTVMKMWFDKLHYDARFTRSHAEGQEDKGEDIFHRWLDVLQVCAVATALSRIRSPDILSDLCQHNDMFLFSLSLLLNSTITMWRYLEVYLFATEGDLPATKVASLHAIVQVVNPSAFYLLATAKSGYSYYGNLFNLDGTSSCGNGDYNDDVPIYLCLTGWLFHVLSGYVVDVLVFDGQGEKLDRIVERSVPRNIHFCIHRYGEWFMLMFGESIISLIIVDGHNEAMQYKLAFFSGIVSVMALARWHFESQPHHPDDHALSRSRHGSFLYAALIPLYSLALIAVGVSYKLFLYEYTYLTDDAHRRLGGDGSYEYSDGTSKNSDQDEPRQQFAANLFCVSMASVLVCMDLQFFLHKGIPRLRHEIQQVSKGPLVGFFVSKYTVVLALATFSMHHSDPHVMAAYCLGAMLLLEFLSNVFARHLYPLGDGSRTSQNSDPEIRKSLSNNIDGPFEDSENKTSEVVETDDNKTMWSTPTTNKRTSLAVFEREALVKANLWIDQGSSCTKPMDHQCRTTSLNRHVPSGMENGIWPKHPSSDNANNTMNGEHDAGGNELDYVSID